MGRHGSTGLPTPFPNRTSSVASFKIGVGAKFWSGKGLIFLSVFVAGAFAMTAWRRFEYEFRASPRSLLFRRDQSASGQLQLGLETHDINRKRHGDRFVSLSGDQARTGESSRGKLGFRPPSFMANLSHNERTNVGRQDGKQRRRHRTGSDSASAVNHNTPMKLPPATGDISASTTKGRHHPTDSRRTTHEIVQEPSNLYGVSSPENDRPRHEYPNKIQGLEYLTTVRQDWQAVVRRYLDTVEPHMFSADIIRKNYEDGNDKIQEIAMLVIIGNENVTYVDKHLARRQTRQSSAKYVIDKIWREKKKTLRPCTFLVMLNDGRRPLVPTFGSARHWKRWTMMIPVPLGNTRGPATPWATPFQGWDDHVFRRIERTHSNYTWDSKQAKAVFRGGLIMQTHKLGSCNEGNDGRCEKADRWNQVNRGWLYERSREAPELFDVAFTQHRYKTGAAPTQFNGVPKGPGPPMKFEDFQNYKYILNVGSNQDWAERLRSLLYMNSAVVIHQAETEEFFSSLLQPWIHYIPTDLYMDNLVGNIRWAIRNDISVRQIVKNQNAFARRYISESSMQQYWEVALEQFAERQAQADKEEVQKKRRSIS